MKQSAAISNKKLSTVFALTLAINILFPAAAFSQTTMEWLVLRREGTTTEQNAPAKYNQEDIEKIKQISLENLFIFRFSLFTF
jgi:hypothetical protein